MDGSLSFFDHLGAQMEADAIARRRAREPKFSVTKCSHNEFGPVERLCDSDLTYAEAVEYMATLVAQAKRHGQYVTFVIRKV